MMMTDARSIAGPNSTPNPLAFRDSRGRAIDVRPYGSGPVPDEFEALVAFYGAFDPKYRSDGVPPVTEPAVRKWLGRLLTGECLVAWHDGNPVGQAVLVPDADGGHELAVFVGREYQRASLGRQLVGSLLTTDAGVGAGRVWLLTTGDNRGMLTLGREYGFVATAVGSGQVEMARA